MSFSIYFRENVSPSLFLLIYGLIILFSFYLIIIIINFFIKHSRHVEYLSKLPGLKTWDPITGNVFPFIVKYLNGNLESSQCKWMKLIIRQLSCRFLNATFIITMFQDWDGQCRGFYIYIASTVDVLHLNIHLSP